jgi:polysaccharide deacetylase family protein (PEP-CTERM system associated)
MINALTIDVEDHYNLLSRDWLGKDMAPTEAVVTNTRRLLEHLGKRGVRATFFVLGEVAESFPDLIRAMVSGGHELGVHGYYHRQVFKMTPDEFRREVRDAKAILEDVAGIAMHGHRAPAFSIMPSTRWALDVLADLGFRYDSSIFPIAGRRYGWPGFSPEIHEVTTDSGAKIIEAPLTTVELFGRRWPACGGGYIRHFPGFVSHWAMRRVMAHRPVIVYLHPYEIDTMMGPADTSGLAPNEATKVKRMHWLQLRNRKSVEPKILSLLDRYEFAPLCDVIEQTLGVLAR